MYLSFNGFEACWSGVDVRKEEGTKKPTWQSRFSWCLPGGKAEANEVNQQLIPFIRCPANPVNEILAPSSMHDEISANESIHSRELS